MNIQEIQIERLKPYWRNPRKSEAAIQAVRASIERYGYQVPILVDREHVIIAGHARYAALNQLGYTHVKVMVVDLPPKKAAALRIADNKTHEWSTWDPEQLEREVKLLADQTSVRNHFKGPEWDELFGTALETPALPRQNGRIPAGSDYKAGAPICPYCGVEQ